MYQDSTQVGVGTISLVVTKNAIPDRVVKTVSVGQLVSGKVGHVPLYISLLFVVFGMSWEANCRPSFCSKSIEGRTIVLCVYSLLPLCC